MFCCTKIKTNGVKGWFDGSLIGSKGFQKRFGKRPYFPPLFLEPFPCVERELVAELIMSAVMFHLLELSLLASLIQLRSILLNFTLCDTCPLLFYRVLDCSVSSAYVSNYSAREGGTTKPNVSFSFPLSVRVPSCQD